MFVAFLSERNAKPEGASDLRERQDTAGLSLLVFFQAAICTAMTPGWGADSGEVPMKSVLKIHTIKEFVFRFALPSYQCFIDEVVRVLSSTSC